VEKELRGYLDCGTFARGVAHYRCECGQSRVAALTCHGRGFCPRCGGRRMTELALDLCDRVLPHERIRQWVLSFPWALRVRLAFHHELVLALARIARQEIERRYRRLARAAGFSAPCGGSVTVVQRFGSDLRLNIHLHMLALDGCYGDDGRFFTAPPPTPEEVESILAKIVRRTKAVLERRDEDEPEEDDLGLARGYFDAASSKGTAKHGESRRLVELPSRRKARIEAFDLDAEVAVRAHDRERLGALVRYVLRPPLAQARIAYSPPSIVTLELKAAWPDGTTHVTLTPQTFIKRLASLVPRPRKNTVLYAGVLAPKSSRRKAIVPDSTPRPRHTFPSLAQRSLGVHILGCRRCGKAMTLVAVLHRKKEVRRLLEHLGLWKDPLPLHPARGPPQQADLDFGC
jgi:hypothetical protein